MDERMLRMLAQMLDSANELVELLLDSKVINARIDGEALGACVEVHELYLRLEPFIKEHGGGR